MIDETPFPPRGQLKVLCAHAAYRLAHEFRRRAPDIACIEARSPEEARSRIGEADVACMSGLWRNDLLALAPRLRFIQSTSAGVDNFDRAAISAHGARLASAHGVSARAVAEHAMALLLALTRRLPEAFRHQRERRWRGMIGDPGAREMELSGKTMLIVGHGLIGAHLAGLARAFGLEVIAARADASRGSDIAEIIAQDDLPAHLPRADVVALCCPLTERTRGMIGSEAFAAMRPGAIFLNLARGAVVDEAALVAALSNGRIGAAGLDCFAEEPLPEASPLWSFENVIVTPHSGGETRDYEQRVIDLLLRNIDTLVAGERRLFNEVV